MNRQRLILFVLLIGFAVSIAWSYKAVPRQKTVKELVYKPGQQVKVDATVPSGQSTKPQQQATDDDGSHLKLELLDREPAHFKGYRRNLFKPLFFDEFKMAKLKSVATKQVVPPPVPQKIVTPPVDSVLIQPEPAQPLARFTFLGFLKKGSIKTIFLAKDKDILLVKKGDKIADRYQAEDITDQALTLTVLDTGDEIVIPLIENRPLISAK
jgi:hypothetical protein